LIDATQGSLDGDPVVLPLPEDAPNEIPIIILRSKDDKLQVNISRTRVDFLAREARARSADSTLALSHERLAEIGAILRSTGSAITRHALVTVWSAEPEKGGARYVIDNYLQPDPLVRNAANAEMHIFHRVDIANVSSNRWVRLQSVSSPSDALLTKLAVVVDINSSTEKPQDFDARLSSDFLSSATAHTTEIIRGLRS